MYSLQHINPLIQQIILAIAAFIIAFAIIPVIIKVSKELKLFDTPNHRASHTTPTPTMGGIAIFLGVIISMCLFAPAIVIKHITIFIAITLLFATGFLDDLKDLSPKIKLAVQIAAAALVCINSDIRIQSLQGIFGIHEIPLAAQYSLTILLLVGATNAFNLLDGIDGLAGSIITTNSIILGLLFHTNNQLDLMAICIALAAANLAFLKYNFAPAKIFMGDTGSLFSGFLITVLALKFTNAPHVLNQNNFILFTGMLLLPVFDTLRVFGLRILKKKSPFSADKTHLHHILIKTGLNHKKSTLILFTSNLILIALAITLTSFAVSTEIAIIALFSTALCLSEILTLKRLFVFKKNRNNIEQTLQKIHSKNHLLQNIK